MNRVLLLALLLAGTGLGQAHFEAQLPVCLYTFPSPCGAQGDPEGVSWNGLVGGDAPGTPTIDIANAIGMPCAGNRYARIHGQGPLAVPVGGPMPPVPAAGAQLFIPIPIGAVSVSLCWDYYCMDTFGPPDPAFNDGMSIDLIGQEHPSTSWELPFRLGRHSFASPCGTAVTTVSTAMA